MKTTVRTDIHRKSALIPAHYEHVLSYNLATRSEGMSIPSFGVDCHFDRAVYDGNGRMIRVGEHDTDGKCCLVGMQTIAHVKWAEHGGTGRCTACGASFIYGEVWKHIETGDHIHTGHQCADNYNLLHDRSEFEIRAGRAKQAVITRLVRQKNDEARKEFLEQHVGLEDALETDHYIVKDIKYRFVKYCNISEKQIALVMKLYNESKDKSVVEEETYVPAPEGRTTFSGTIVKAEWRDDPYHYGNGSIKMTVKVVTDDGVWIAWGTCPAAISDAMYAQGKYCEDYRGTEVEITATLKQSDKPHFAFFKRPRGSVANPDTVEN